MARIFIVEDDPMLRELYRDLLALRRDQLVGEASDGQQCLAMLTGLDSPPDVVLMDHRMPGMTGLEATRALLERRPGLRVLFVSADVSIKDEALAAGARGFLQKPFRIDAFNRAIDHVSMPESGPDGPGDGPGQPAGRPDGGALQGTPSPEHESGRTRRRRGLAISFPLLDALRAPADWGERWPSIRDAPGPLAPPGGWRAPKARRHTSALGPGAADGGMPAPGAPAWMRAGDPCASRGGNGGSSVAVRMAIGTPSVEEVLPPGRGRTIGCPVLAMPPVPSDPQDLDGGRGRGLPGTGPVPRSMHGRDDQRARPPRVAAMGAVPGWMTSIGARR
jgi:two-component system chemotaxis response regulator CheY